ncbi:hypothetical protein OG864_00060 [Streptomyces sp. NBC_00124]|uniref:hypothetical protein n=1 Tax=Streptomyces sp. NBC_00124 TaxID=2975662 RepID=UPI0022549CEE|nr:hypothetical protein [Streptomyces sp. NBC_00124]MCX5357186.1 hypothetical protein [Streptomyces sp. NBC_00124]
MADIPDELIKLERSAEEARVKLAGLDGEAYEAQWARWWEAAVVFQAAVTAAAAESGTSRVELEMSVKKVVRHAAAA